MLVSHRVIREPRLGALIAEHSVLHSRYRLILQIRRGVIDDPSLFAHDFRRQLSIDRSTLLLSLAGDLRIVGEGGTREFATGTCATELRSRRWSVRKAETSAFLLIEWEPGSLGTRLLEPAPPARISPLAFQRLCKAVQPVTRSDLDQADAAKMMREITQILRAEGFPFEKPDPEELIEEVPDWAVVLGKAVDRAISSLIEDPMLVDLEDSLGWSERQIQRRIKEFHERYASRIDGGWRSLHRGWRFSVGASLMSTPTATTEKVAKLLGYSSPRAFCDAFANAGLPSPGALGQRLRSSG